MNFEEVWADVSVKRLLQESISENRVSHAQLFIGKPGWGTLDAALAYAKAVLCENTPNCELKVDHLSHPDLHFSIPTFNIDSRSAVTKNYIKEFKGLIKQNHFVNSADWYQKLDAGNKQGFLSKEEIMDVMHTLTLKSYEGGYKVMIIWYADKMKTEYANKFLKLLEEPPEKTLFILISESEEEMLETITSRCLTIHFKPLSDTQIAIYLEENYKITAEEAIPYIARAQGDISRLQSLIEVDENKEIFEQEFIEWTRNSAMVKSNLKLLQNIIQQGERIAEWKTEQQKQYIQFCIDIFRSALMNNYQTTLSDTKIESNNFNFSGFSSYVYGDNIEPIIGELNQTYYYIERNVNKKLAFTNLGIKLTRFIQKKHTDG